MIAAYQLRYRTGLKPGGTTWIIGTGESQARSYTISAGFDEHSHPARLVLSCVPPAFEAWLRTRAGQLGIEVIAAPDVTQPPQAEGDDIVVLGADPDLVETVSPHLAHFGILTILAEGPMARKVNVDVGRVHYNRWVYVGSQGSDVAAAYRATPGARYAQTGRQSLVRRRRRPHGTHARAARHPGQQRPGGDPMHRRQRPAPGRPVRFFRRRSRGQRDPLELRQPHRQGNLPAHTGEPRRERLRRHHRPGAHPVVIFRGCGYLAPKGVMNVFAGLNRGMQAALELSDVYLKDVRVIGHSASTIDDLRLMLHQAGDGELSPNRSVAAVGSLNAAKDGLAAVRDTRYPGKVVIYPQIKEFPSLPCPTSRTACPAYGRCSKTP